MLRTLKDIFGFGSKLDFAELVKKGAIILDVRTNSEYDAGHIKGSINIPLNQLSVQQPQLKDKEQIIITCCASGIRSASAQQILRNKGYLHVYDGGGWISLKNKI